MLLPIKAGQQVQREHDAAQADAVRPTERRVLEGPVVTDPDAVLGAYQLGDFEYQVVKEDGTRRRARKCLNQRARDEVVKQVCDGAKVVIKHLPPRP